MLNHRQRHDPVGVGATSLKRAGASVQSPAAQRPIVAGADDQRLIGVFDDCQRTDPGGVSAGEFERALFARRAASSAMSRRRLR